MSRKNAASIAACLVIVLAGAALMATATAAQDDQILPGCSIPKSWGNLMTIMAAPNTGLAGQAVFEDRDGVVRWVALMFSAEMPQLPKPTRVSGPMFPQLPRYECAIGHVWQRH